MILKEYLERAEKYKINKMYSVNEDESRSLTESVMEFLDTLDFDGLNKDQISLIDEIFFLTESDNGDDIVDLNEQQRKMVVRAGKKIRKLECPEGKKAVDGKCVKMTAAEKRMRVKGAKMAAKKRRSKKTEITRKRLKSLAKR